MKFTGFFFALLLLSGIAAAQTSTFVQGDKVLNLGIGFGNGLYLGGGYTSRMPALSASFEVGVKDGIFDKGTIGVGGYLGYASAKWEYSGMGYTYGWKYSNLIIGARGTFHYPLVEKLDTYGGLLLGYDIVTSKEIGDWSGQPSSSSSVSSGVYFSGFVGARYYFTNNFAAMAELGSGIAYVNLGVALKF